MEAEREGGRRGGERGRYSTATAAAAAAAVTENEDVVNAAAQRSGVGGDFLRTDQARAYVVAAAATAAPFVMSRCAVGLVVIVVVSTAGPELFSFLMSQRQTCTTTF